METDYISREAAQNITGAWLSSYITDDQRNAIESVEESLGEIPAADVRPVVRGIWIEIDDYVLCANCGVAEYSPNRKYCHNCGADMRKVVEIDQIKEDVR